ncbi:MAG: glycosyltransferase family 2 protein [Planctomycetota bacterium]|jgi:GT2 family glycosyltransferase
MDISIIIVSWNTKEVLRDCLRSVFGQAGGVDCEVIVVDNASTDGSVEMLKNDFGNVILMENAENRGFAAANNQAMAVAKGRYVLLLNSDTIVLEDCLADIVSFADANPQTAVVGCRVLNADRTLQPTCFMFPSVLNMVLSSTYLYKLFPRSRFFGREQMLWWDASDVREVDVVRGCFMLVRREAIDQVGVMDEQFFMYGEETDWCYRFKKNGWKVTFAPVGQIIHLGGASSRQDESRMRLQLSASILLFLRKHTTWIQYAFACLLTASFFVVRVPYWLGMAIISRGQNRKSVLRLTRTYILGSFLSLGGWKRLCVK